MSRRLHIVMYHYVRDLPNSRFPRIKGMLLDDFVRQIDDLSGRFEMASLESALAFLDGQYKPEKDLCVLTFDDGVREHYEEVTPVLAERGIQGLFFLITGCVAERRVAEVHKSHFLMASLPFSEYREKFLSTLHRVAGETLRESSTDADKARRSYIWDTPEVAEFKYFFNFVLDDNLRNAAISELFAEVLGDETSFANELYVGWGEAREMQRSGMVMGGHTHSHRPIAVMTDEEMRRDLDCCRQHLDSGLAPQPIWPFSYPYGKSDSFNQAAVDRLRDLRYHCSFTTERGANELGADPFRLQRVDCKQSR